MAVHCVLLSFGKWAVLMGGAIKHSLISTPFAPTTQTYKRIYLTLLYLNIVYFSSCSCAHIHMYTSTKNCITNGRVKKYTNKTSRDDNR